MRAEKSPRNRPEAGALEISDRARADAVTVPRRRRLRTSVTLSQLEPYARRRLLARLDELDTLERLARQPGTLAGRCA